MSAGKKDKGNLSYESQDTKVSELETGENTVVGISALISDSAEV